MKKETRSKKTNSMLKKQILLNLAAIAIIILLVNLGVQLKPSSINTTNTSLKFEWTGLASYAFVDENPEFTSPIRVEKSAEIELKPGTYYWCVPFLSRCLDKRELVIESEVALTAEKISEGKGNATYKIENKGNVPIGLAVKNILTHMITGFAVIDIEKSTNMTVNETSQFIAEQND